MERPTIDKDFDSYDSYIKKYSNYCDFLEDALTKSTMRINYWCTKATEAKIENKILTEQLIRLKREN